VTFLRSSNGQLTKITVTSWEMLGTNLSIKKPTGEWGSESQRLLLMDRKDFNILGIGIDDLIDAYIQTVLSVIAIDKMCIRLMNPSRLLRRGSLTTTRSRESSQPYEADTGSKDIFDYELFESLNPDKALLDEIWLH
jgi:hypothetical protein